MVAELKGLVKNVNSALVPGGVTKDKMGGVSQGKVTEMHKHPSRQ